VVPYRSTGDFIIVLERGLLQRGRNGALLCKSDVVTDKLNLLCAMHHRISIERC
jgi:hypothetical protein